MTCELAQRLLIFSRPGVDELDGRELSALETHLGECAECRARNDSERQWDEQLAHAIQNVAVPAEVSQRVIRELQTQRRTQLTKRITQAVAFTLMIMGLWWVIPGRSLDAEKIALDAYNQVGNREGVEEWLKGRNRHFAFPPRMNGQFLVGCEYRDYHGVSAPVLTFVRQNAMARVAILTTGQFRNLPQLPDGRVTQNSVCTVMIVADPDHHEVVYLIEVINGPVELFYNELDATVS